MNSKQRASPTGGTPVSFFWRNRLDFGEHDAQGLEAATAAGRKQILESGEEVTNALIILNTDCVGGGLFHKFWAHSSVRVCADGGANRLFDGLGKEDRVRFVPQAIKGDLDSVRPEVAQWYEAQGTRVIKDADQDTNDLEKCLDMLKGEEEGGTRQPSAQSRRTNVFVLGALGQRFDHAMANCHLLYRYDGVFRRLVLLGNESLAFLLPAGKHYIEPDARLEGPVCGLIPLAQPCRSITTQGLKWNLKKDAMAFGGLVSTSNEMLVEGEGNEGSLRIDTSDPIVWTTAIKEEWRKGTLMV